VSARKYRPSRFDTVIGQEHVVQTLKNAIRNRHLAHAFLFCGPRGVGKTTSARLLAKTINCTQLSEDFEACNTCDSCKAFNANASFNIYELDAASNNSVEDIRGLVDQVRYAPQGAQYKIYIIDEVHMLSSSAFNAFLKTLEEPPPYAKFILATTEKHKILPTILSRCQVFDFHRIKIEDAVKQLKTICQQENIVAEEEALHVIAKKADGAMRDALSIFDRIVSFSGDKIAYQDVIANLNILDYDYYFKATNLLLNEDLAGSLLLFDEILNNGFEGQHFLQGFAEHLRNLMVCRHPDTLKLLEVAPNVASKFANQAKIADATWLLNALNILSQTEFHYKTSRNQRLHVELALMKLCNLRRAIALSGADKKKKHELSPSQHPKIQVNQEVNSPFEKSEPAKETTIPVSEPKIQNQTFSENPSKFTEGLFTLNKQNQLDMLRKQVLQRVENTETTTSPNSEVKQSFALEPFTKEDFENVLQEYIAELEKTAKTRISSFLKQSRFKLLPDFKVELELRSKLELELLDEEKLDIIPFFRSRLKNGSFDFVYLINSDLIQTTKKASKQDVLKLMNEKNPILADFVTQLGLEIEY